ncbi:hypothetical protein CHRYSEOSP005_00260 [Chryseobacterium sp. Alg-005]|uniref:SGNH/GDSL hydrolase family protein n=1 Tax=Chryseobacterium sp. Alg-005 TaxID=3159516 RepID=UPI0035556723
MSYETIQERSNQIRNETQAKANSKSRIADQFDDVVNYFEEKIEAKASGYKGYLRISDNEPVGGWEIGLYKLLEFGEYDNLTPAQDENGNPTNITAEEGKINDAFFDGTVWRNSKITIPQAENKIETWVPGNYSTGDQRINPADETIYEANDVVTASDIPGISPKWSKKVGGFSEEKFNELAEEFKTYTLESADVSAINFTQNIAPGAGSSIYIEKITEAKHIDKIRIKVQSNGVGDFTLKRSGVKIEFASNIPLVAGWNEFAVDLDIEPNDNIGYNTATSTASLYFKDGGTGKYIVDSGTEFPGSLAIELYSAEGQVNTFEQIVKADLSGNSGETLGTSAFNAINSLAKPKLREIDYGVVSAFNLPDETDLLGNNKITVTGSSIAGNFLYNDYAYTLAFTVTFQARYTTTKTIANINLGTYTLDIIAGGSGIFGNIGAQQNGFNLAYENSTVKFVIVADAYFLNMYVNGTRVGFLNKSKKATQVNFTLNKQDSKSFGNICLWNRDISEDRITQWNLDQNPFNLKGIKDKLFPAKGYQISDHLLTGNPYFEIPAEQSIVKFKGKYFLYFTAAKSTPTTFIESGIGVAVSNRPDGGFMMYTDDVVIGGDRNKAGVTRAMASWAGVVGDYVYIFAAMDYTASNAGGKIFKSSDGLNFTLVGNFITSGISYLANISIFPEKKGSYYYGIAEGKPGSTWKSYLVRSLNFESGWEVVQMLTSLEVTSNQMYGGPELLRSANDDRWMCFYHAAHEPSSPSTNSPTSLYYAECFDTEAPINWVNKKKVLDINDELDFYAAYNCDQVATPQLFEENGKLYLSYVLAQNEPTLHCQIRVIQFDGTKEELVGAVPLEYDKNPVLNLGSKFNLSTVSDTNLQYPEAFTKIIASGTSITNGVGSDGSTGITEANTWRSKIQATLTSFTGRTITVVNGGVNGQNTTGMKNNLPALLSGNTGQVVILEGAINDAQTAGVGLPVSTTISNLGSMIEMVINSGNYPVLSTPMPLDFSNSTVAAAYTVQKRDNLVLAVHMLAKRYKIRLIDFDKAAENNVSLLVDGIHPNINGYAFMSDLITPELV